MGQDQVSGGVSLLCWLAAPVAMVYVNLQNLVIKSKSVIKSSSVISSKPKANNILIEHNTFYIGFSSLETSNIPGHAFLVSRNWLQNSMKHYIYWSNVLTERVSIPYKNQTKEDTSFYI